MANLIGPDVSFYQDEPGTPQGINFVKMKQSAGYVIIRSGQNTWIDSAFKTNWQAAKSAGLPRGSYWFYDSRSEPKKQAELWFSVFEGDFGELPLFADLEESYGGPYTGWRNWRMFLDRLKALAGGREIAIYTAYFYWIRNAPNASLDPANLAYFHQYPLWIANYGVTKPSVPKPWTADEWLFWQYTDSGDGKAFGVESSRIDLDYFNGDLEAFKLRFKLGSAPPPPPPQGPVWYKVTAEEGLNVRTGPGTNFTPPIGLLKRDEVVEGLAVSADGGWAQIKRASDNLTGWSSKQFLIVTTAPPPPPPVPTNDWFRVVNAAALNVREGPGTDFKSVGLLNRSEVVKRLATSPDGAWFQIKRPFDGLTGWSSKTYLAETNAPPQVEEPMDTWFQVTATGLNVREGPASSFKSLGFLSKNDGVIGLDTSADGSWRKIERVDGLTGWCSGEFLKSLGKTPAAITQKLFAGVVYHQKIRLTPKRMVSHALVIDLQAAAFEFLVTPPIRDTEPFLCTRTTTGFLEKYQLHMAINGDGFTYLDPATYDPKDYCAEGGEPIRLIGFASSRGKQYSTKAAGRPILYISPKNGITVDKPSGTIFNAITGDRMLVTKGVKIPNLESTSMNPRTAIGVNQNGRWLVLVVVDGREFSEGATFPDLADLLLSFGVYTGMSMDGGGSSTLAIKGIDGKPRAVSKLFDEGVPGQERRVANHLGIYIKK